MAKRGAPIGNQNAAKGKVWSDALRKEIERRKDMGKLAAKLVNLALEGNIQALKELGDRLEGRSSQSLKNEHGEVFKIEIKR
jgi:hypothetical protein